MHREILVVAVHLWVCYTNIPHSNIHDFTTETVVYIWGVFVAFLFSVFTLLFKYQHSRVQLYQTLNKYMSLTCLMFIMNVALSVFTSCKSFTYCFFCHAMSCIIWDAILDIDINTTARASMVLVLALHIASINLFPIIIDIHGTQKKLATCESENETSIKQSCTTFETAHLWAMILINGLQSIFNTLYFVLHARYVQN